MALPKLAEAAYPLCLFTYLATEENLYYRALGITALVMTAVDWIRYMDYMDHIQVCPSCAARAKLASFIAERIPQESL